jgi:hypothetical protein
MDRSFMTYSWNQFRPAGLAFLTFSIVVVPRVDSENGMPAAAAAPAPAVSPLGLHEPGEAGRCDAEGQGRRSAQDLGGRVDVGDVGQHAGMELHVLEGLPGAVHRELALGRTVGVVECRGGGTTLRDRAQVVDGLGLVQARPREVERRLAELHELEDLFGLRELTCDHRCPPVRGRRPSSTARL